MDTEDPSQSPDNQAPIATTPPMDAQSVHEDPESPTRQEGEDRDQDAEDAPSEEDPEGANPKVDYSQDQRVAWMVEQAASLDEFNVEKLTNDMLQKFFDFLEQEEYTKFFVWLDNSETADICLSFDSAPKYFEMKPQNIATFGYQVAYFLKHSGKEPIVLARIEQQILVGVINDNPLDDLLNKMTLEYVPKLHGEQEWPDGVKKEFQANLNKFMATLTEESAQMKGKTQLYIPEEHISDIDAAIRDKDLIQRLESTVIYWTRQIKEVVSSQDTQISQESTSPLDEIEHWRSRTTNLKALTTRLQENKLKKIIEVLTRANSSYLQGFKELEEKIKYGYDEANDNLQCLSILQAPCKAIQNAQPKDIPKLLPEVLNNVRMIWEVSRYYNTNEKMKSLLTKISNQIIQRCRDKIDTKDMFGTNVEKCIADLDECIECCNQYREISKKMQRMIANYSVRKDSDLGKEDTIFAENEAFIQRCRDLREICEGQLQFALAKMPVFGGTKGKEWTVSLLDLQKMFEKHLRTIENLSYDILDVKVTLWHEDYGQTFKEEVKQIEIIYTTIIALTFKNVSTIEDAVEMLENFYLLARRPAVMEYVQKKAAEQVYKLFMEEIKQIEDIFEAKSQPPMPFSHPTYGGIAIWSYSLIVRANRAKDAIDGLYFIQEHPLAKEAYDRHRKLTQHLDESISKRKYEEWLARMGNIATQERIEVSLQNSLLVRQGDRTNPRNYEKQDERTIALLKKSKPELLESNFDIELLKLLFECQYWNKIQTFGLITFPLPLTRLLVRREQLRVLRENVMLVVRDYNNIIQLVSPREKQLFNDHLSSLDKFIEPGIRRFNWLTQADAFVNQCRNNCLENYKKINDFQIRSTRVTDQFQIISSTILTKIKKGQLYELKKFMDQQEGELAKKQDLFKEYFEVIRTQLFTIYESLFLTCKQKIQAEWLDYLKELDKQLQKSLKNAVKNSLIDFQKHVHGDAQEIVPIFRVFTIIDTKSNEWKIVNQPSHDVIKKTIANFIKQIVQVTAVVPRLEGVFRKDREEVVEKLKEQELSGQNSGSNNINMSEDEKIALINKKYFFPPAEKNSGVTPYVDTVSKSSEINNVTSYINEQVQKIKEELDKNCRFWEMSSELRFVLGTRTERGKARLFKQNHDKNEDNPVQQYKTALQDLAEKLGEIRDYPPQKTQEFISIEFSLLKQKLLEQGQEYSTYILDHLKKDAKTDLTSLIDEMRNTVNELKQPSSKLEQLRRNKERYAEVRAKQGELEARLNPIRQKFAYLLDDSQNEATMTELNEEDKLKLASLDEEWNKFIKGMAEAHAVITKNFGEHKAEMDNSIEDFKKEVQENRNSFKQQAPFSVDKASEFDNIKPLEKLTEFKLACVELRQKEEEMKPGLEIFEYESQQYVELTQVERENQLLTEVWELKDQFDNEWFVWKEIAYADVNIDDVEERCVDYYNKLNNMTKEIRAWPIFDFFKQKLTLFRTTLPLALQLRDEAIRPRHWNDLRFEVKEEFNEQSEDFSLERIFDLQLHNHINFIDDLCHNARNQLKIEKSLIEIKRIWEEDPQTNMDITKERSKNTAEDFYRINSTENILTLIEEHSQHLAAHKSSPYYKQFSDKIDFWENNIANITETIELLIQVQGKWQYLESIFKGQPDLAKQLGREDAAFKQIDKLFRQETARIYKEQNCYRALIVNVKDFIKSLTEMNRGLEQIQKELRSFLEGKRGIFPRFYFLSNEDLLEIIGQGKDPTPINKHIKKIFEGINSIVTDGGNGKGAERVYLIKEIKSQDLEVINLDGELAVKTNTNVEQWLQVLNKKCQEALRRIFNRYWNEMSSQKKSHDKESLFQVITKNLGQILITMCQIEWTRQMRDALKEMSEKGAESNSMRRVKKLWLQKTLLLVECVERQAISFRDRTKIIALIMIEEHNREVIEKIAANKAVNSVNHFEWQSQLKFEKDDTEGTDQMYIVVKQLNATFNYGYEYQGNNGRLVITPLTDRAYMTLTNALQLCRGGAPQGPAGTGKTETVKDLGKNLAFFVVIQNCGDQMDQNDLGQIFIGLSQAGAWGCFDEFNRILLDVLSVITSQIQNIMDCIKKGDQQQCNINDKIILVSKDTGLFITMNPGYAGRSELPDNLANLFRPVAMMVPDFNSIAKITLMSEGFKQNEVLAKKVCTIYELMLKQLSKADHYDFGLRAVKSVLNAGGRIKREQPDLDETTVMIKAIRDMNLPKFIAEDVVLFDMLFMDLFPDCEEPQVNTDVLQLAIEDCLNAHKLQLNENLVVKIMQLYESKVTRHGNMLVGFTQSGKSKAWQILQDAMNLLNKEDKELRGLAEDKCTYKKVVTEIINPKSISVDEFFGYYDLTQKPKQWMDGVCSAVLKTMCSEPQNVNRWMVLDGPVDTLWIESMNSVLDDNKLLTLNNGDRIALTSNVRLLFEVQDLSVASPATVSRAGMIYMDVEELGWRPLMEMWILDKQKTFGEDYGTCLTEWVLKYLVKVLTVKRVHCLEMVVTSETACVRSFCNLFDSLVLTFKQSEEENRGDFLLYIEKWFVFCLIWSIGATVDEGSRREIDNILRDIEPSMFPHSHTVYEHYINKEKKDWASWEEKIQSNWKPIGKEFHEIVVPTIDTVRNRFLTQSLLDMNSSILLVGHSGVGKTVLVDGILRTLDQNKISFTINFSAGTTSNSVQEIIESQFDRRAKNRFQPKGSKLKAVCFIDDMNMPKKEVFGAQPPIELLRQWIDYGNWFDKQKVVRNYIMNLQLLAAMGKPGGGRAVICPRMLSKFHVINYTVPSEQNLKRIFESLATFKFHTFPEEIKALCEPLAVATIQLFNTVQEQFLPTPTKSHYVFNMRDISKVFQGMYMAQKSNQDTKEHLIKLWGHEILRIFHDRLISVDDQTKLKSILNEILGVYFQFDYKDHCMTNGESDAVFVDFLQSEDTSNYEEVTDFNVLRTHMINKLEAYNQQPKTQRMDIVLFKEAIIHCSKIYRVLNLKRGHALLVGVGGSGRHSLTRLCAYLAAMNCDQLEIRKDFTLRDFRTKLKELYELSAFKGKWHLKTVFIFSDNDVVQESFLEDIQNTLNSGVVPNLYTNEELNRMRDEGVIVKKYREAGGTNEAPDAINEWFFNRVKDNLHLSICMSPVGEQFRNYVRQYPALINNTTIDWFMAWPEEALIEVATKFLQNIELPNDKRAGLANLCGYTHFTTQNSAQRMEKELKRIFYVTPTNFVELLKGFDKILATKRKEVGAQITKLKNGLGRLEEAREGVKQMTQESEISRAEVTKTSALVQQLMDKTKLEKVVADDKAKFIQEETIKIQAESIIAKNLAAQADAELAKAMPGLNAANAAVAQLDKKFIAEMKALNKPPHDVGVVMDAVMVFLEKPIGWASVKKELNDTGFLKSIMDLDKDHIQQKTLKRIETYTKEATFTPEYMNTKSAAAGALCTWVRAIEDYAKCLKIVVPKREKKEIAEANLRKMEQALAVYKEEFDVLKAKLDKMEKEQAEKQAEMDALKAALAGLQSKIDRGEKLVSSLADEKANWIIRLASFEEAYGNLMGDSILAAAFMSYAGPFPSDYRNSLNEMWFAKIKEERVAFSKGFQFSEFLADKAIARKWQNDGLPTDDFSTENGVFVTKGLRWALNIDPQTQANNWIKKMCPDLIIADQKDSDCMKKLEQAIQKGHTLLLQDVGETLDPTLDNVLNKAIIQNGKRWSVKFGSSEIEYNMKFQLYITTRLPNPHYTPEISTKVNVVNFIVKESGLEEQCLGIVVRAEQPQLEIQKNEKLTAITKGKAEILALEDSILARLNDDSINLLEDEELVSQLHQSKETSDRVKSELENAEANMKRIDDTREGFRSCGKRAAVLFFVLNDLSKINPMYQFSLDWYKRLFEKSISESKDTVSQDRNETIMKVHKLNVYNQACRSLFERHKLLLALQMFVKLQMADGKINPKEYDFFLRGGTVLDRKSAPPKPPQDWLTATAWDNVTEAERLLPETFAGLPAAVSLNFKEWQHWFSSDKPMPEEAQLPGEWETKCEDLLKKMIILRCFRPDRVIFAIRNYVHQGMKSTEYIHSKPSSLSEIYEESTPTLPIIFVLTAGVDPTELLIRFANEKGATVTTLSLGKGQSQKATEILNKAAETGQWCFLSNCHLSISLLPELESIMDQLFKKTIKKTFRLFLSASPHEDFPISLLQRSLKIAQEPPSGIKANMSRLYGNQPKTFTLCIADREFRKAVFGLSWFHTIMTERKKFKTLGWNVSYAFNDSDYQVCEDSIANYMGRITEVPNSDYVKGKIPWQAIQYLIAECNYGGRITDDRDRRLIKVYAKEIFDENLVALDKWRPVGTEEFNYQYPADEANTKHPDIASIFTPDFFLQEIQKSMEVRDQPQAFGQHTNAEITSQILDTNELLYSILSLQPQQVSAAGKSPEEQTLDLIVPLRAGIPDSIDVAALKYKTRSDDSPLTVVLIQEIQRYNILLAIMRNSLDQLQKGIKGEVVISPELEKMIVSLSENLVPKAWSDAYPSLKSLGSWVTDLKARYEFFALWAAKGQPFVFHISYFTYPTGFTTSLLQRFSRKAGSPSIDRLEFDFIPTQKSVQDISEVVKDGAFITGLYLEGAKWNLEKQCLMEPEVMELICLMPVLHFKPIPKRAKQPPGLYECPCYYYPNRQGGIGRDSYMLRIDLKTGDQPSDFWVKRGTALLMSTAS